MSSNQVETHINVQVTDRNRKTAFFCVGTIDEPFCVAVFDELASAWPCSSFEASDEVFGESFMAHE